MSAATALIRSLRAEARKTAGLPGVWLGAALALALPVLVEYYVNHDLADGLAAGDPRATARLGRPTTSPKTLSVRAIGFALLWGCLSGRLCLFSPSFWPPGRWNPGPMPPSR